MQATSIIPAARHYSYEGEFDMVRHAPICLSATEYALLLSRSELTARLACTQEEEAYLNREDDDENGEDGQAQIDGAAAQQQDGIVTSGQAPPGGGPGEGQKNTERMTTPYMTKYERARILGTRALQISWVARISQYFWIMRPPQLMLF